jgi:hypothetical protein
MNPSDSDVMNDPEVRRAIEDNVGGIPPIDLDEANGGYIDPTLDGYAIDNLMHDLILAEYLDSNNNGEVKRGEIYLPMSLSEQKAWRVAKIIKHGPDVPETLRVGTIIRFPANKGINTAADGKNLVFLNADRVFCTLKQV